VGRADYFKAGDWNIHCQECWEKYKATQIRKRWDGFWVCYRCWEPRHPQDFIRGIPDRQNVPFSTSDPAFIYSGNYGDLFVTPSAAIYAATCINGISTLTINDGGFAPSTVNIAITMMPAPIDQQLFNIFAGMFMPILTVIPNAGQSITAGSFTNVLGGQNLQYKYTTAGTLWTLQSLG